MALRKALQKGSATALESFWQEVTKAGTPLVEPIAGDKQHVSVTFLWRASTPVNNVVLDANFFPDAERPIRLEALADTDLWYKSLKFRNDVRFHYELGVNHSLKLRDHKGLMPDPLNPRSSLSFNGEKVSFVDLPGAKPQPWLQLAPGAPQGRVEEKLFQSTALGNERRVWIYTPPGSPQRTRPYPVVVLLDGRTYLHSMTMPATLNNLIAKGRIPPLVAVMVDTARNRNLELHFHEPFVEFLDKELLPWLSAQYRVTTNPEETILGGASAGGLTAAFAAYRHPDRFGNVLSQSGAFAHARTGDDSGFEWLLRQYASRPKMKVRFYLEAGVLENSAPSDRPEVSLLDSNRHMRDVLKGKGYEVHYQEVGGGHQPVSWRGGVADGLIVLAGSFPRS